MHSEDRRRLLDAKTFAIASVGRATAFVERHHRRAAARPFEILASVEALAGPTRAVRSLHDGVLYLVYGGIRTIVGTLEATDRRLTERFRAAPSDASCRIPPNS